MHHLLITVSMQTLGIFFKVGFFFTFKLFRFKKTQILATICPALQSSRETYNAIDRKYAMDTSRYHFLTKTLANTEKKY